MIEHSRSGPRLPSEALHALIETLHQMLPVGGGLHTSHTFNPERAEAHAPCLHQRDGQG